MDTYYNRVPAGTLCKVRGRYETLLETSMGKALNLNSTETYLDLPQQFDADVIDNGAFICSCLGVER